MATPIRKFSNDLCYHVYNRGVEGHATFTTDRDYKRFLEVVSYYLNGGRIPYSQYLKLSLEHQKNYLSPKKSSESVRIHVLAYCLMPNHFHFLLKQAKDGAISAFMSEISNSYTKYFNTKNNRLGYLFQASFKAKEVTDEASFLQVSRYIHLNPVMSSRVCWKGKPENYPYSSYKRWVEGLKDNIVNMDVVKKFIEFNPSMYRKFVESKISQPYYTQNFPDLLLEDEA